MARPIEYHRDARSRMLFARVVGLHDLPFGSEYRRDSEKWIALDGAPILRRMLDGDPFLDRVPLEDIPTGERL